MASDAIPTPLSRFKLPGFGLPLNYKGSKLFVNALDNHELYEGSLQFPLTTLREFTMLHIMNELTDKPNWHKKVFDETIASKWKAEVLSAEGRDVSQKMVDWCIDELRYKAKVFEETGAVSVYNGDVVKSDTAIPASLKTALREAVAPLEEVPAREKDWHPGSDEMVLDLVHPSLFPLVYGRSRVLPDTLVGLDDCIERCGEGITIPIPPGEPVLRQIAHSGVSPGTMEPFSKKFQWLPCDVDIAGDNDSVRITSYINNLHPQKHKDLYSILEKIIACTIPLWSLTLTPLDADIIRDSFYTRITYDGEYDPDPAKLPQSEGPQREDDEDEDVYYERREQWIADTRKAKQPEPHSFEPFIPVDDVDLRRDYDKTGLQVIVKLANIHLTPEKPKYAGGSWHVEGQLNEHICASAIYYYDSANISTSRLAFRQQSNTDDAEQIPYEQDQHDWLSAVFGCENYSSGTQDVGTVDTTEGRLLTWPNILQHQVQPFELADHSKPGYRKILALFLVDPNIRIISTANVPCQQRHWWSDSAQRGGGALTDLPLELREQVFSHVEDFPLSLQEAKELRLELMEERKDFVVENNKFFGHHSFSLCEH